MQRAKAAPSVPGDAPGPSASADPLVGPAAHPSSEQSSAAASRSSYAGIALAAAIFAVVVIAWNAAPWRAPQKIKIDPTDLKLDRSLDLQRPSPKGTTSP